MRAFDASNPRAPRYAGSFTDGHEAQKVDIGESFIAVADNMDSVRLLGLNEELQLCEIGQYKTGNATHDVFCSNGMIFLADGGQDCSFLR